jgi:hypothetical protein
MKLADFDEKIFCAALWQLSRLKHIFCDFCCKKRALVYKNAKSQA